MRVRIALALVLASGLTLAGGGRAATNGCAGGWAPAWSPDGQQIAWVALRSHLVCFARPNGSHVHALRQPRQYDRPVQLAWPQRNLLVGLGDYLVYSYAVRPRPRFLGPGQEFFGPGGESFSLDARADLLATGTASCGTCSGPVALLRPAGGRSEIGGTTFVSTDPSLSPDGSRVAFVRGLADDSGRSLGLWIASTDGSGLHRFRKTGDCPLWSPRGGRIAFLDPRRGTLVVESAAGGRPIAVVPQALCGSWTMGIAWSPNGRKIAFAQSLGPSGQRGAVLDVATGRITKLRRVGWLSELAWSPDSRQLLVSASPDRSGRCRAIWRLPVGGGRATLVSGC